MLKKNNKWQARDDLSFNFNVCMTVSFLLNFLVYRRRVGPYVAPDQSRRRSPAPHHIA
jgi:hypothetical protein